MNSAVHDMRAARQRFHRISMVSGLLLSTACAFAQVGNTNALPALYPAGSIQSVEIADQALKDVRQERSRVESQFGADQRACYPEFFATSCLEQAKDRRRQALAKIRPIEVEANTFKRRARVVQRDQEAEERMAAREADAGQRKKEREEKEAAAKQPLENSVEAKPGDNEVGADDASRGQ